MVWRELGRARLRVVEIYADSDASGTRAGRVGSGYAIGDDLVLTAGHLIDADDEADWIIQVRPLGERDWLVEGVSVVWCRRDSTIDAALLRVESAPWRLLPDEGALRWARPAPDQRVPCTTIGFPESQTRPGGVRDTDEAVGRLSPNTRAKGGWLTVDVESPTPTPSGLVKSPWSGMSGAALLSSYGRRLLGVVVADMHAFGNRRLEAVGVEALLSDQVFAALVGHPGLDLVDARERPALDRRGFREPYEALPARYAEAELLVPHHRIVPFLGRAAELSALQEWCRSAPRIQRRSAHR